MSKLDTIKVDYDIYTELRELLFNRYLDDPLNKEIKEYKKLVETMWDNVLLEK